MVTMEELLGFAHTVKSNAKRILQRNKQLIPVVFSRHEELGLDGLPLRGYFCLEALKRFFRQVGRVEFVLFVSNYSYLKEQGNTGTWWGYLVGEDAIVIAAESSDCKFTILVPFSRKENDIVFYEEVITFGCPIEFGMYNNYVSLN